MLAYYLTINAYEAFEAESRAWYQDDNRMRNEYARVSTELDTAIGAMQKVHRYEMSLFPQKKRLMYILKATARWTVALL